MVAPTPHAAADKQIGKRSLARMPTFCWPLMHPRRFPRCRGLVTDALMIAPSFKDKGCCANSQACPTRGAMGEPEPHTGRSNGRRPLADTDRNRIERRSNRVRTVAERIPNTPQPLTSVRHIASHKNESTAFPSSSGGSAVSRPDSQRTGAAGGSGISEVTAGYGPPQ
jgi:hypothetical protein